jgi:uncharacterized lipoprotein YajG
MINKMIAAIFLLASLSMLIGCQSTRTSTSNTDAVKATQKSPVGPVGKLKFDVPKDIDLTDIINGSVSNAEKETIQN